MTFISQLYTGSISDREIIRRSGFLNLPFDDKDSIMADKGFTIQDLLPLGVSLNLPPFLEASSQIAAEDVVTRPCEQGNWDTWMILDPWNQVK